MSMLDKPAVFVFTTAYYPFVGGAEIAIAEVAKRLGGAFCFFIITARFRKDLAGREERPEATVIRVGLGRTFDKWLLLFLGPLAALREFRRIGARRPFLWGMDISSGSAAAAILKCVRPRLPFVLSVQYGYGGERLNRGRMGLIGFGYRFMLGRADAVTAISSFLAGTARRFGWRREIAVIPNGVAIEHFGVKRKVRIDAMRPVVITVSRLVHKNGVDTLIRAIAEVRKSVPDVRCHILGDGPERFTLEALARSFELGQHVKFFGNIPNTEVPRYLADADIFVRPSRSEGMGNAFVEALAAGLPIIGTPVEGILDIIVDYRTGLFAKTDDPADVADKILRLIRDPALARRIAANGRVIAEERFSWHKIAADYARIFNAELASAILIAAPQFPPDIGGPGRYANNLAEGLLAKGCRVSILSYGPKRNLMRSAPLEVLGRKILEQNFSATFNFFMPKRNAERSKSQLPAKDGLLTGFDLINVSHGWPSGLKHFIYFVKAFKLFLKCDMALVLDPVIVGFPVALAARLTGRPIIVRVEGDFLWEWSSERTKVDLTLRQFYERFEEQSFSLKERLMYKFARFVFSQARYLVFSSQWRKEIFKLGYPLKSEQARFISPPWPVRNIVSNGSWPEVSRGKTNREKVILFAGRFIHIKNLPRLIKAFLAAAPPDWRLELIGDGPERPVIEAVIREAEADKRIHILPPLARNDLMEKIAGAYAFVLPSLSDVSPNVILDCIASGTPFLLTKESGFYPVRGKPRRHVGAAAPLARASNGVYETLKDIGVFADPQNEKDIQEKLRLMFDPKFYAAYSKRLENFKKTHSWGEVAEEWLKLIRSAL